MPSLRFEYHPDAIHEAHEAFHWYDRQSETAADRFWDALRSARVQVTRHPERWPPYYCGARVFRLRKFPYGLVYSVEGDVIVGWAVCHFKRRPGYWRSRLAT